MVGLALVIGLCVVFEVVESWRRAVSCVLYSELERVGVMELVHQGERYSCDQEV
jgi:hypothetical protein